MGIRAWRHFARRLDCRILRRVGIEAGVYGGRRSQGILASGEAIRPAQGLGLIASTDLVKWRQLT